MAAKIIFIALGVLLLGVLIFMWYLGFFSNLVIEEKTVGPYVLVYEEHIGPYSETGQIQNTVYRDLLQKENIETFKGFGIYYSDPKTVPAEELKSIAGCILEQADIYKIDELKQKGYKVREMATQESLVVSFPFTNKMSILAGMIRVYPALTTYVEENNIPQSEIMELYDVPAKKVLYIKKK